MGTTGVARGTCAPRIDTDAFVAFEAAGWAQVPDGYHRFFGPITAQAADPLLDAARVGPGSSVLDVATGPGYLASRAVARGASPVGVDLAEPILALARRLNPGVPFRRADAHTLEADLGPDWVGRFDAVVAGFLLPHLGDHDRAVTGFARALRPGGWLALSTWDLPGRVPVLGAVVAAVAAVGAEAPADLPAGPPFFAFSTDEALSGLLDRAGLVEVTVTTVTFSHAVGSVEALWEGVLGGSVRTAALVNAQPAGVRRQIRASVTDQLAPYRNGEDLHLPVSVKVAAGRTRWGDFTDGR